MKARSIDSMQLGNAPEALRLRPMLASLLLIVGMSCALMANQARAGESENFSAAFSAQATLVTDGTTCATDDCNICFSNSAWYAEAYGISATSFGTMFIRVRKCLFFDTAFGRYAGSFSMASPNGKDSVSGTYAGQNDANGDGYGFNPFSGVLTITAGTGKFSHSHGNLAFSAQAGPAAPFSTGPGTFNDNFVLNAYYAIYGKIDM
jgi:hypothetical protein